MLLLIISGEHDTKWPRSTEHNTAVISQTYVFSHSNQIFEIIK